MFIKNLDAFGKTFNFNLVKRDDKRKTLLGGCLTLICYLLALAYFIYLAVLWGNYKLQPKITMSNDY